MFYFNETKKYVNIDLPPRYDLKPMNTSGRSKKEIVDDAHTWLRVNIPGALIGYGEIV